MKKYTETEIKAMAVPDIIKKMVEFAEGFEYDDRSPAQRYILCDNQWMNMPALFFSKLYLPLLIYRAVEGWNKKNGHGIRYIRLEIQFVNKMDVSYYSNDGKIYQYKNYQAENLTQIELALLHCLIETLGEVTK